MTSPAFPEPPPTVQPTPISEVDARVARLVEKKDEWVATGVPRRMELLQGCIEGLQRVASDWVETACRAKGIPADSQTVGEEWLGGPMTTVRNVRLLLEALAQGGQPKLPRTHTRTDGQLVVDVFPTNALDKLLYGGFSAQVWIEPGKPASQGRIYREKEGSKRGPGKVALVLGAGNVASIGPMDALYKLFVEDEVVILKTNPVNAYLGPFIERAFAPLFEAGVLAIVHGGAEVGQHLSRHDSIDTIHMTGSNRTHDAIVWGATPEEQERRKAAGDPICTKPVSSELGAVTPVFVVPGPWSEDDLDFQARHVAGMVANNASFNCNAAKALVTAKGWPLRAKFLEKVEQALGRTTLRKAYYPGAQDRYRGFLESYPDARKLADVSKDVVPWTILPDVAPVKGEYALTNEAFCGVLAEVALDATDADEFLAKAAAFGNDVMWGSLSCVMLVHPETERAHGAAVEAAIAALRYGGIGVNVWAGVIYGLVVTTWGAFPGHALTDIQSGRGVVHNTFLLDHPQKSVVRAPFRIKPTPVWFADHRTAAELGRKLVAFEASPGYLKLPGVIATALRG